jgi:purine nucleosidase
MTETLHPVYLDCDTGIDDALALGHLLASPNAKLVGVGTVHGNIDAAGAAENTLRLLTLAGRSGDNAVPVAVGAGKPLVGEFSGGAVAVHGDDGIGGVRASLPEADAAPDTEDTEDAVDLLVRLSHEYAGELQILAIGPLTNLAHALVRDPTLVDRIAGVTVMGGAALVPGNARPAAEANIWHDPEAAQATVAASWPVTLVPLDTTMEHTLDETYRRRLAEAASPYARACGEMLDVYLSFYETVVLRRRAAALHDPLAAAIMLGEVELLDAPRVHVEVDCTDGPSRGSTICDLRSQRKAAGDVPGATVRVVLETAPGYVDLLTELLESL